MITKKCYSDDDKSWTKDGHNAADTFRDAIQPIFKKLTAEGYSPRELMGVALLEVQEAGLFAVLDLRKNDQKK